MSNLLCRNELISSLKYVPTEQLLRVSISARGSITIPLEVTAPGSVLSWYFTVDYGDIDFWITYESVEVITFCSYLVSICRSVFGSVI